MKCPRCNTENVVLSDHQALETEDGLNLGYFDSNIYGEWHCRKCHARGTIEGEITWGDLKLDKMYEVKSSLHIKRNIIENFIDWFTSNEEMRLRMKSAALDYIIGDHVDEIAQSCPTWEQLRDAFFAGTMISAMMDDSEIQKKADEFIKHLKTKS